MVHALDSGLQTNGFIGAGQDEQIRTRIWHSFKERLSLGWPWAFEKKLSCLAKNDHSSTGEDLSLLLAQYKVSDVRASRM